MKAQEHEKEIAVWLLNLANDMRRAKQDKILDDLPPSVQQDPEECIIANAFNYGCTVDPGTGVITFQTEEDRNTYLKIMNINPNDGGSTYKFEGYGEITDEDFDHYYVYDTCEAPMTKELIEIAESFDSGYLFSDYTWGPEDE